MCGYEMLVGSQLRKCSRELKLEFRWLIAHLVLFNSIVKIDQVFMFMHQSKQSGVDLYRSHVVLHHKQSLFEEKTTN